MLQLYNFVTAGVLFIAFGYISLRMVFPSIKMGSLVLKGPAAAMYISLFILVLWAVHNFAVNRMGYAALTAAPIVFLMLIAALQVLAITYLRVTPSWDFGDVMSAAKDIAAGKPIRYIEYFETYPHNLGSAFYIGIFTRLTGGNMWWAPYVLNILSVDLALVTAFLLARKIFGDSAAFTTVLLCLLITPLYLYAPIVYTDTLSMPFPLLTVYFWIIAREAARKGKTVKALLLSACIGLWAAAGYLLKPVGAIGLAAIFVETLWSCTSLKSVDRNKVHFLNGRWGRIAALAVSVLVFAAGWQGFRWYMEEAGYTKTIPSDKTFPYTHWVAMGMNKPWVEGGTSDGYGGFSGPDVVSIKEFPTYRQKVVETKRRIRTRLNAFGNRGYAVFLLQKLEWTWTDGTFYVPEKLGREPVTLYPIHKYILNSKQVDNRSYLAYSQVVHGGMMLMICLGSISLLTGRMHPLYRVLGLMCLGLMFFLLLWETRSRYLTFLIPVFAIMAAAGIDSTLAGVKKTTMKWVKPLRGKE